MASTENNSEIELIELLDYEMDQVVGGSSAKAEATSFHLQPSKITRVKIHKA